MKRIFVLFSTLAALLACAGCTQTTFDRRAAIANFQKEGDKLDADYGAAMNAVMLRALTDTHGAAQALTVTKTYCDNVRDLYARQTALLGNIQPVAIEQHQAVLATCAAGQDVYSYLATRDATHRLDINVYKQKRAALDAASEKLDKANAAFEAGRAASGSD
jgi:hypothetical protein